MRAPVKRFTTLRRPPRTNPLWNASAIGQWLNPTADGVTSQARGFTFCNIYRQRVDAENVFDELKNQSGFIDPMRIMD